MKYKVWECKIVVPAETELPWGFDSEPRQAARQVVLDQGIEVVAVFSGWGGSLTEAEQDVLGDIDAEET